MLGGVGAVIMLAIFVEGMRVASRMRVRWLDLTHKTGLTLKERMFNTEMNYNVARDPEMQTLRRRMTILLLIWGGGLITLAVAIRWVQSV